MANTPCDAQSMGATTSPRPSAARMLVNATVRTLSLNTSVARCLTNSVNAEMRLEMSADVGSTPAMKHP
eukprot:5112867-Amphidinium_carterae.1